jgi:hypothetical protein
MSNRMSELSKIDDRTKKYFDDKYEKLNCIGTNGGEELSLKEILKAKKIDCDPETLWKRNLWINASVTLLKYTISGQTKFCAEVWIPYGGDGLYTHTYIFKREPTDKQIIEAHTIENIRCKMSIGEISPTFTCWECGCEAHWLDNEETLENRWQFLQDKYCGC